MGRDCIAVMVGGMLQSLLVAVFVRERLAPVGETQHGIYVGIALCLIPVILAVRFCIHIHHRYRALYSWSPKSGQVGCMLVEIAGMYFIGLVSMGAVWKMMTLPFWGVESFHHVGVDAFLVFAIAAPGCLGTYALLHGEFTDEFVRNYDHGLESPDDWDGLRLARRWPPS